MNPGYRFEEFPKALYRNGEYCAVETPAEEKAQRRQGWTDWPLDQQKIAAGKFADGGGLTGPDQGATDQTEAAQTTDQAAATQTADLLSQ